MSGRHGTGTPIADQVKDQQALLKGGYVGKHEDKPKGGDKK